MKLNKITVRMVKESSVEYNTRTIQCPLDIVKLINTTEELNTFTSENILVICLNSKNKPVNYQYVAKGGATYCELDIKEVFKPILLSNANKFILVHNHPSGDSTPSKNDLEITVRLKESAKLLDIKLLDHIIIGDNNYTSCIEILEN